MLLTAEILRENFAEKSLLFPIFHEWLKDGVWMDHFAHTIFKKYQKAHMESSLSYLRIKKHSYMSECIED